jgi:hypothetical protein
MPAIAMIVSVSILVPRLELEGKRVGVLIIVAEGLDRFTEKHANLIAILNEPFSMALSNVSRCDAAPGRLPVEG